MTIWFGGDYNPEQWPRDVWDDDVRLMQQGGVTLATVAVFSWARLEPREGEFDFEWLDTVIDKLHAGGIAVDLATATAVPPPWLTHKYPEVLPLTIDGVRLYPGSRQQYCPSSPVYRRLAARLVTAIAERYGSHPAVRLWHVNNEYACHVNHCYCDVSAAAFRRWLEARYETIARLNEAWGTSFWSQNYGDFEEVYPPRTAPTFKNPAQLLDFDRFSSDELLECFMAEARILREVGGDIPITTNFLGFSKLADYWKWAREIDVISYDSYPDPVNPESHVRAAMAQDLMRSLKGGQPWLLMEQAPSAVSWNPQNSAKAPGQMRAWSYQALARGADGIMFFQWRQSVFGAEKFLTGMLPHAGVDTRVWHEIEELGREIGELDRVSGTRISSRVAMMTDWDSWWSLEQAAMPAKLSYLDGVLAWYRELYEQNVTVDFIEPGSDLSSYDLVIVPSLFAASASTIRGLDSYVTGGGHLLVTYQTAITDENAHITAGGYLGPLQKTLGVWVEEFAPLVPDRDQLAGTVPISGEVLGSSRGETWSEFVRVHDAVVVARFLDGALDGWPALTRRSVGAGAAWYVATLPAGDARTALVSHLLEEAGIASDHVAPGVEVVTRGDDTFVIDHRTFAVSIREPAVANAKE